MSSERIRELLDLMQAHDVVELELEVPDFKVRLRKPGAIVPPAPAYQGPMYLPAPANLPVQAQTAPSASAGRAGDSAATQFMPSAVVAEDKALVPIKSPIVGTFYKASSPDSESFVQVGSKVAKDSVVCIIEAMKIMNEIKAGVSGTIEKILVENGEPVEFGQPLFLVKP